MKTKLTPGQEAPIEQWLAEMPEPYASAAIGQIDKDWAGYIEMVTNINDAIAYFNSGHKTIEGFDFWYSIYAHYDSPKTNPLPPYSPEHLPIEPQGSYNGQSEIERMKSERIDLLKPALPDFYVGMEIVAKVALNQITEGKTYTIAQLVPKDCFMIINNLGIPHHVRHENFHKYFTLKNQPMNPTNQIDPNELKPAKEWLKYLPEPLRTEALEACEKWPLKPTYECAFAECIANSIHWDEVQPQDKWPILSVKLYQGEILPVQPEEVKEEKPEQLTDLDLLRKEVAELRKLVVDISSHYWNNNTEAATPEPEPRKLPLTIEEVNDYYKSFEDGKTMFPGVEIFITFLHDKTKRKLGAIAELLKIAEAQNEMTERGETVYYAWANNGRSVNFSDTRVPINGQIIFHSEQGLKDCIAANEQLFKDYLEI